MHLTRKPIRPSDFLENGDFKNGATVLFLGKVRDHSEGKKVLYLEYEAYETMAEKMIAGLIVSTSKKFQVEAVTIRHRLGRLELGEIAVAIAVEGAHRDETYAASRFLIEEIKHRVPIWKKETFADGTSEWGLCKHHADLQASA